MPTRQAWHVEQIKAALRIRGGSFAQIAKRLGVSKSAVSAAARSRDRRSKRIEAAIASGIGVAPARIWPDRYAGRNARTSQAA
jgi:lambda repressor-like predicted transcriptional regulator